MTDIFNISQINDKFVFFKDDTSMKMTRSTAELLYNGIRTEQAFYNRMYDETAAMLSTKKETVDAKGETTETDTDVIRKMPLDEKCKAEVAREYYLADVHALHGFYEMLDQVREKRDHCDKLMRQIKIVLEEQVKIVRVNV